MYFIIVMGAVALSHKDEAVVESLQQALRLPSKARVIHQALEVLQQAVTRERLAREIRRSVQKCAQADHAEHRALTGAAFHRTHTE